MKKNQEWITENFEALVSEYRVTFDNRLGKIILESHEE
jgi:hypothetical protein